MDQVERPRCPFICEGRTGRCWKGTWDASEGGPDQMATIGALKLIGSDLMSGTPVEEAAVIAGRDAYNY